MPSPRRHRHTAFLSYAQRYASWALVLRDNLERVLGEGQVFLDKDHLKPGESWVSHLQRGLGEAQKLIVVATPEALASPRVADEWETFITRRRDWGRQNLQIVLLVDGPLPPFLSSRQVVDFCRHNDRLYRQGLCRLLAGLLDHPKPRHPTDLPTGIVVPPPPVPGLDPELRRRLVAEMAPVLRRRVYRKAVVAELNLNPNALEGFASADETASAALVYAQGNDTPVNTAFRVVDGLLALLEDEDDVIDRLQSLRHDLEAHRQDPSQEPELLQVYLDRVVADHERLVDYFQRQQELELLDRVFVQLELGTRHLDPEPGPGDKLEGAFGLHRPLGLRQLLDLEAEAPHVTHRWVVRGDPGAGKTTLLRHLASTLASEPPSRRSWVPVFASLPRLVRERGDLLERIEGWMEKGGQPARGLPAVLDREGQEGRLLLLLDGLDEVSKEDQDHAENYLRVLAQRWPQSPLVVTSRPIGYRRPYAEFREVELLPFDRKRRLEFLARWFGRSEGKLETHRAEAGLAVLGEDSGLWELAGNPLYLTLMALILERGDTPHHNRPRLYDQVFDLLLEGRHRPEGKALRLKAEARKALIYLGHQMTQENRDADSLENLESRLYRPEADELRPPLERVPRWRGSMRLFLEDVAHQSGILGPHDGPHADWRFWHRTFREALTAEGLAQRVKEKGTEGVLDHAGQVEGDESRWAEPYALLTGQVPEPDALLLALLQANRALGLRALATAQGLKEETFAEALELSEDWEERSKVYRRLPELVGEGERALALLDRLRRQTRNGNDLFFLHLAVEEAAGRFPAFEEEAKGLLGRFFDHILRPKGDLFRRIEIPKEGKVALWCEVPEGSFLMGSPEGEGHDDERPQHEVRIEAPFRLAAVTVTNAQYEAFDPDHGAYEWEGVKAAELSYHPVVGVTWFEAVSFCRWLGTQPETAGARLPTEEEWEYACRAGSRTRYWSGDGEDSLKRVGWYDENSDGRTHRVGERAANPWGLYDVHGNVWEWTESEWTKDYSAKGSKSAEADPTGGARVIRGGGYWLTASWARSACRGRGGPGDRDRGRGFRVCLPAAPSS